eukprot:TRINITY_DN10772_c0_g1_i3.p2 TRINITY_DN10772_c0_g1~~TRINITY_DN10772_c0_g1_i3.p2  ORF type:complete len:166 (-),score=33.98 TRINITY_DN10772_c0_g1_i3:81-578(-)
MWPMRRFRRLLMFHLGEARCRKSGDWSKCVAVVVLHQRWLPNVLENAADAKIFSQAADVPAWEPDAERVETGRSAVAALSTMLLPFICLAVLEVRKLFCACPEDKKAAAATITAEDIMRRTATAGTTMSAATATTAARKRPASASGLESRPVKRARLGSVFANKK